MPRILLAVLLIVSYSCGKSNNDSKRETRIEEIEIPEVMNHQNFECASINGACPDGIARLLIVNQENPDMSAVCSGFMVGPDKLVTNNHCVSTQAQCRSTFIAVYNGNGYLKTRCSSIIATATDGPDPNDPDRKRDYTVMKIADSFSGSFFPVSTAPVSAGDILDAWVVDHTGLDDFPSNLTDSRITQFECVVMDQTERASLMMIKCPIISGNSGSPVSSSNGAVAGVLWGGSASSFDTRLDLDIRRQLDEVGLATPSDQFGGAVDR